MSSVIPDDFGRGCRGSAHSTLHHVQRQQERSASQLEQLFDSNFSCYYPYCSRFSDSLDSFLAHCKRHAGWHTHICSECGFETTKEHLYAQHLKDKHPKIAEVRAHERSAYKSRESPTTAGTQPMEKASLPPFKHRRVRSEVLDVPQSPSPRLSYRLTPVQWDKVYLHKSSVRREASLPPVAVKTEVLEADLVSLSSPTVSTRARYSPEEGEITEGELGNDEADDEDEEEGELKSGDEEEDELESGDEEEDKLEDQGDVQDIRMRGREQSSTTSITRTPSRHSSFFSDTFPIDQEPHRSIPRTLTPSVRREDWPTWEPVNPTNTDGVLQDLDECDDLELAYPDTSPSPSPAPSESIKIKVESLPPGSPSLAPSKREHSPESSSQDGGSSIPPSKRKRSDPCPVCKGTFNRPVDLNRHIGSVQGDDHDAYRRDLIASSGASPFEECYVCCECDKEFALKDAAMRHTASQHHIVGGVFVLYRPIN
ncbi:hypothetical protein OF83DRAFT_288980 [Amylostereum chailletii]|nr:hypothetical protein OF83DRAFT_288980 [Amylostereum chailletii]